MSSAMDVNRNKRSLPAEQPSVPEKKPRSKENVFFLC